MLCLVLGAPASLAGAYASGLVYRTEGAGKIGVRGAEIAAYRLGEREPIARAKTGAYGRYALPDLPPGRWVLKLRHPEYFAPSLVSDKTVQCSTGEGCGRVDFRVKRKGALEVRLEDAMGRPVTDARVRITRVDGARVRFPPVLTERGFEGKFRFAGIEPGRLRIEARPRGLRRGIRRGAVSHEIEVTADQLSRSLRLVMPTARLYSASGRVMGLGSIHAEPADWFLLLTQQPREPGSLKPPPKLGAPLEPDGRFALHGIPPGEYAVVLARGTRQPAIEDQRPLGTLEIDRDLKGVRLSLP